MNVLAFRNRQQTHSLNLPLLRRLTRHLLQEELGLRTYELGVHFVDAAEMARLNWKFLQHDGSTDVITFDNGDDSFGVPPSGGSAIKSPKPDRLKVGHRTLRGEIYVSVPDAVKQAREFGTTWQSELVRYVIHGLLHLRGFDDVQPKKRREMKREENRLLLKMTRQFPLKQIERQRRSQLSTLNSQPR